MSITVAYDDDEKLKVKFRGASELLSAVWHVKYQPSPTGAIRFL